QVQVPVGSSSPARAEPIRPVQATTRAASSKRRIVLTSLEAQGERAHRRMGKSTLLETGLVSLHPVLKDRQAVSAWRYKEGRSIQVCWPDPQVVGLRRDGR